VHGDFLAPNTAPPPHHPADPNDWTPYESRLQFETADFLYKRNQMSASDIDCLLNLWAASLAEHGKPPPFASHKDLYDTIDSTPHGDVQWENFSLRYNSNLPEGDAPSWMTSEFDVWFRDPRTLVQNLLSNPDFDKEFDYAPLQEYDMEGNHRFQDFMSGDWAWKQAVFGVFLYFHSCIHCFPQLGYYIRRSGDTWIHVCPDNSRQRQDHSLCRHRQQRVLAFISIHWKHSQ
jgi:hypothetical protein